MAKSPGIRKTLEQLLKKVETLENQVFGQKLLIDELEGKLSTAEEQLKKLNEDPFGFGKLTVTPFVQPVGPTPMPQQQYLPSFHVCQPNLVNTGGQTTCSICGAIMNWPYYTTNTNITCSSDPAIQSSTDVEPILDLDISWALPDEDSTT
jgi:hypothetical protein